MTTLLEFGKKLDILGPIERAETCLDIWLKEESRALSPEKKKRVSALIARYFLYEDDLTENLMLSFLGHYSDQNEIDMEDPTEIRMEIKGLLASSDICCTPVVDHKKHMMLSFMLGACMVLGVVGIWMMIYSGQ